MTRAEAVVSPDENTRETFSHRLRSFFVSAGEWPWRSMFPNLVFIRDYHELPDSSPHDIDLMISTAQQPDFLNFIQEKAREHGLYCHSKLGSGVCFILLFDLAAIDSGRTWAFLEARDAIQISSSISISAKDVEIRLDPVLGIPVPTRPWKAFLEILQGCRTGKISKTDRVLRKLGIQAYEAGPVANSYLGPEIRLCATLAESLEETKHLEDLITIKSSNSGEDNPLPLKTRLNRFAFRHFYFVHHATPLFFSIHGPDGVGKSTACSEVERIFRRLPLRFGSFHHITGWKYRNGEKEAGQAMVKNNRSDEQGGQGLFHRLLRWVYRRLPGFVQENYVLTQGYHMYLKKLNNMFFDAYCSQRVFLVDRYIYDLVTKNKIKNIGLELVHRAFVRIARKPLIVFMLTDDPKKIRSRKQELTLDEIEAYLNIIPEVMQRRGAQIETIQVSGHSPNAIAQIIITKMLDVCGPELLSLVKAGR